MNKNIKIETTENGAKIFYSISNYDINRRIDIMLNELDKLNEWVLHNENEAYLRVCLNRLKAYENMRKEAIEYAKNSIDLLKFPSVSTINEEEYAPYIIIHDNYLNILNKVGEDND